MITDVWGDFKREIFAEMVVGVFSWEFSCEKTPEKEIFFKLFTFERSTFHKKKLKLFFHHRVGEVFVLGGVMCDDLFVGSSQVSGIFP